MPALEKMTLLVLYYPFIDPFSYKFIEEIMYIVKKVLLKSFQNNPWKKMLNPKKKMLLPRKLIF